MPMTPLAMGAAKASAYRDAPPNSLLTSGMTVVTARDSNATRNTRENIPTVIQRYWGAKRPSGAFAPDPAADKDMIRA